MRYLTVVIEVLGILVGLASLLGTPGEPCGMILGLTCLAAVVVTVVMALWASPGHGSSGRGGGGEVPRRRRRYSVEFKGHIELDG